MNQTNQLNNLRIVVTGALGALGREVCSMLESQGVQVLRLDLDIDGEQKNCFQVDLTDFKSTQKCFDELGEIDGLINLAGGFEMGTPSWESSDAEWDLMFRLNVATLRNAIKSAVPLLLNRGGGTIVNVGAYGAQHGQSEMGAYCASKSVVMRLTESLAEELKNERINVNAVLPTIIDTPANRSAMPKADPSRWVSPTDLASIICFLSSPAIKAVHGALLPVRALS